MSKDTVLLSALFVLLFVPIVSFAATLTVNSTNPGSGLSFAYRQTGQTGWQGASTSFSNSFSNGAQLEIAFPFVAFSTGKNLLSSVSGCDSVSYWSEDPTVSNLTICSMTMNSDKSINVQYSSVTVGTPPTTPDIFWQNGSTGAIASWTMDGTTKTGESALFTVPTVWEVVGAADFNGDGEADLLLSNQSAGSFYLYYMGSGVLGGQAAGGVPDTNWKIAALADFNSDGSPDYLWYHEGKGYTYIWLMGFDDWHGIIVKQGAELNRNGFVPGVNWRIRGTRDFNGDGKPDILWQDQGSGELYIWYMNGTTVSSQASIAGAGDLNWVVKGVGDFSKDGKPDILWRNQATGQNEVWFMNGKDKTGTTPLTTLDTSWDIAVVSDGATSPFIGTVILYFAIENGASGCYRVPESKTVLNDICWESSAQTIIRHVPDLNVTDVVDKNYSYNYSSSAIYPYTVDNRLFVKKDVRPSEPSGSHGFQEYDPKTNNELPLSFGVPEPNGQSGCYAILGSDYFYQESRTSVLWTYYGGDFKKLAIEDNTTKAGTVLLKYDDPHDCKGNLVADNGKLWDASYENVSPQYWSISINQRDLTTGKLISSRYNSWQIPDYDQYSNVKFTFDGNTAFYARMRKSDKQLEIWKRDYSSSGAATGSPTLVFGGVIPNINNLHLFVSSNGQLAIGDASGGFVFLYDLNKQNYRTIDLGTSYYSLQILYLTQ